MIIQFSSYYYHFVLSFPFTGARIVCVRSRNTMFILRHGDHDRVTPMLSKPFARTKTRGRTAHRLHSILNDFRTVLDARGSLRFWTCTSASVCVCFPLHPGLVLLGPFFIAKFRAREFVHPRTEILRTAPDEVMEDINFKLQPFPLGRPVEPGLAR